MRKTIKISICCLTVLLLTGCSQTKLPEIIDKPTISISKDGSLSAYLVETFDKQYYSIAELTNMAVAEAGEYNTEHQAGETIPVTVEKVEMLADGSAKAMVAYRFDSTDTYTDYNEGSLFYGTVAEAVQKKPDLNMVLYRVKDNTLLSKEQLLEHGDKHMIITDEKAVIYCPGKVAYLSEGAVYNQDGSVDTTGAEGTVYILLK